MQCRLAVNLSTDMPFWVDIESFQKNFNQQDFHIREVQNVTDAYLEKWFYIDSNGNRCFLIPPVAVHGGVTEFISGRHRTAVLIRHMDILPLSFDFRFITDADKQWISSVTSGPIDLDTEMVVLPDLPIKASLP